MRIFSFSLAFAGVTLSTVAAAEQVRPDRDDYVQVTWDAVGQASADLSGWTLGEDFELADGLAQGVWLTGYPLALDPSELAVEGDFTTGGGGLAAQITLTMTNNPPSGLVPTTQQVELVLSPTEVSVYTVSGALGDVEVYMDVKVDVQALDAAGQVVDYDGWVGQPSAAMSSGSAVYLPDVVFRGLESDEID